MLDDMIRDIIAEVAPFSMVPDDSLAFSMQAVVDAIKANRLGDVVECGTWMGGSSFAILLIQRYLYGCIVKPVWMFDNF